MRAVVHATLTLLFCQVAQALSPYPLQGVVDTARSIASATPLLASTGLKRDSYLPVIHGIVAYFKQFQAENGSIIDPYAHQEIQYATPTYAFASAIMVQSGFDSSLVNSSALALDSSLTQLSNAQCAWNHCNFFTFPSVMAYVALKPFVSAERVASWETMLRAIDPFKTYINIGGNWGLVAVGGEFLRTSIYGFGDPTWWQDLLASQLSVGQFTANGQYQDHSGMDGLNPLPYDTFPCKYLTVMLAQGYNSTAYPDSAYVWELMQRSGQTHLLMQSPWGEIPTGGRSSQHQWNEAASAVIYELQSNWARDAGDAQSACMFKRAAHLSLQSVARWQNANGALQIVKNHFNPELRWGYEVYSFLTNYNLLPAAQLATAYMFADPRDSVQECATFADAGGFVFQLPEFNLVIANARGTYLEIETGSDPHYDSTGLHRVHINTCATVPSDACTQLAPALGPTAGPPQENGGLSIGVFWATSNDLPGQLTRIGDQTYANVTAVTLSPYFNNSQDNVAFTVQYVLLQQGIEITEAYTVTAGQVTVLAGLDYAAANGSRITHFGVTFPAFLFDGATNMSAAVPSNRITNGSSTATVSAATASGLGVQMFTVLPPAAGHSYTWSYNADATVDTRNGVAAAITCEVTPINTDSPSIGYVIAPLAQGPLPATQW